MLEEKEVKNDLCKGTESKGNREGNGTINLIQGKEINQGELQLGWVGDKYSKRR